MGIIPEAYKRGDYWTNLLDSATGEVVTYEVRDTDIDGTTVLDDSKCDGVLYRKTPDNEYVIDTEYINTTVVNVKKFGAVGDQTADDTAAIQAAMDSAPKKSLLFFPAGVYRTTAQLNIPEGKEFIFSGVGRRSHAGIGWSSQYNGMSVILYQGQGVNDEACIKATDSNFSATFKYLTIFNGTSRTDVDGLNFPWFTHGFIDECYVAGFKINLYIGGDAWHSVLNRVSLRQAKEANFYMVGVPNGMRFRDCRIQDSEGYGLQFENASSDLIIEATSIERNALHAIDLQESGVTNILNCHFENNGLGLTEEHCIIRWRREAPGMLPKVLRVNGCTARMDSGIHFVGSSSSDASVNSRMRLIFEGNLLHTGADPGPSLDTYALFPITLPGAVTAVFTGNNGLSRTDLNVDYVRDCPSPNELFKYTSINCGLSLRMDTAGPGSECVTTSELRANTLLLPQSDPGADGIERDTPGTSISSGFNNPEGNVVASTGSLYIRANTASPISNRIYVKQSSGTNDTGWEPLRTQEAATMSTGDANNFPDGSLIYIPAGSSVSNLPNGVAENLYVFTHISSTSPNTARQVAIGRYGRMFVRSGGAALYSDGWTESGRVMSGTTANRPTLSISVGCEYFDTTLGHPVWWDGSDWINSVPDIPDATTSVKGIVNQAATSADTAAAVGVAYDQGEVQAIITELRDLKTKMRAAGLLDS